MSGGKDADQFIALLHQRRELPYRQHSRFGDYFQPKQSFIRLFQDDAYMSLDLQQKILTVIRKQSVPVDDARLPVSINEQSFEPGDALRAEIEAFLASCRGERRVVVSGEDGMHALQTAVAIATAVHASMPKVGPGVNAQAT